MFAAVTQAGRYQTTTLWAVMCGVAQHVQHYVTRKGRANAVLVFTSAHGFTDKALSLVVTTHNHAGIGPRQEICINYGDVPQRNKVDDMFQRMAMEKRKAEEEREERNAGEQNEAEKKRKVDEEAAKKRKAEEEAAKKRAEVDVAAKKKKTEAKGKAEGKDAAPVIAETMLVECTEPPCQIWVRTGRLWIKSTATTNKKISKDFLYKEWTDADVIKRAELQAGVLSWPYDLATSTTCIYAKKEQKVGASFLFCRAIHGLIAIVAISSPRDPQTETEKE